MIYNELYQQGENNMLHLIQLYKMGQDKDFFISIFSDLEYELEELGWIQDPETLINDLLFNNFGLTIESERQLAQITQTILNKKDLHFLKALPWAFQYYSITDITKNARKIKNKKMLAIIFDMIYNECINKTQGETNE